MDSQTDVIVHEIEHANQIINARTRPNAQSAWLLWALREIVRGADVDFPRELIYMIVGKSVWLYAPRIAGNGYFD
jgi:hypothetical protein